jgi:hypothetical protein
MFQMVLRRILVQTRRLLHDRNGLRAEMQIGGIFTFGESKIQM